MAFYEPPSTLYTSIPSLCDSQMLHAIDFMVIKQRYMSNVSMISSRYIIVTIGLSTSFTVPIPSTVCVDIRIMWQSLLYLPSRLIWHQYNISLFFIRPG